jgi:hypothetical protein
MKTYLICAGGSGARTLESVVNLCAAGLGPDKLTVLVVDPDAANGNNDRTKDLVTRYQACHAAFGNKLGGKRYFSTALDLMPPPPGENGPGAPATDLKPWSPVDLDQTFHQLLGYAALNVQQKKVADLLFTEEELNMRLNVGFRGHPSLGAAALALLPLYTHGHPWSTLSAQLRTDLTLDQVRVMLVGSVFGGTGASAFSPLARWLRETAGALNGNLTIGVVALAPYFTFSTVTPGPADAAAGPPAVPVGGGAAAAPAAQAASVPVPDAKKFPLATRAAAKFYDHLRQTRMWEFDAMYWLGDDSPSRVAPHSGGQLQKNAAHFVDLLAGLTCLDFFAGAPVNHCCYYAGPSGDLAAKLNLTTWADIPLTTLTRGQVRHEMLSFALTGMMHTEFFAPILTGLTAREHRTIDSIPWYKERFVKHKRYLDAESEVMGSLSAFFTLSHNTWWQQIHASTPGRVQLLNEKAILASETNPPSVRLDLALAHNLLYPDGGIRSTTTRGEFLDETIKLPGTPGAAEGAPAYLATLASAAERFIGRKYKET